MPRWTALFALAACQPPDEPVDDQPVDSPVEEVSTCEALGLPVRPMDVEGPFAGVEMGLADDFTLETLDGPWTLSDNWTGCDGYIFVNYHPDEGYAVALQASKARVMLDEMPANIHVFFTSYDRGNEAAHAEAWRDIFEPKLDRLDQEDAASWRSRLHYVTESPWDAGWIGESLQSFAAFHFGIDPQQRFREISSIGDQYADWTPELRALTFEARHWNYDLKLQDRLDSEAGITVVPVLEGEDVGSGIFAVDLPDAETMAGFDTLEFDLRWTCGNTLERTCGEWDYTSNMYVCDEAAAANALADTPCQPAVAAVPGTCLGDGVDAGIACTVADSCAADAAAADTGSSVDPEMVWTCEGYEAEIAADTAPATCVQPDGTDDADRQQVCNAEGTGFDDVACPCDTEVGRWITSYSNGGHWVTDVSPALVTLASGGTKRFRMGFGYAYITDLDLRLSNQDKGGTPAVAHELWSGGGFNLSYNESKQPIDVAIPADAQRVELFAMISGHGWGADRENCAEFCNHTHHITVGDATFDREHAVAGSAEGCVEQIEEGTTPNQGGTWRTGRAGWCPGKDVTPWIVDVTAHITPGETTTVSYEALFDGAPYEPVPSNSGQGFGAQINMRSWLVISR